MEYMEYTGKISISTLTQISNFPQTENRNP